MLASVVPSLGVGLADWGAKTSLASMVVLLLAPVAVSVFVSLRREDAATAFVPT